MGVFLLKGKQEKMQQAVLINDHQFLNDLLTTYLHAHGFKSVLAFNEISTALAYLTSTDPPDLVIIDLMLPTLKTMKGEKVDLYHPYVLMDNKTALKAVRAIRAHCPTTKVILLSGERHPHTFLLGFKAGAQGIASKLDPLREFSKILKRVLQGESGVTSPRVQEMLDHYLHLPVPTLTDFEIQILELIQEGKESPQIGKALGYSAKTIRNALYRINEKLGTSNRMEALEIAIEMGLVGWRTGDDSTWGQVSLDKGR
jgi:DNA-binding NarL/FixJ family response regulator